MRFASRLFIASALTVAVSAAQAIPNLQLGIQGGTYDPVHQDIITDQKVFTLYAFGTPGGSVTETELLTETYHLSIAIAPKIGPDPVNFGSFVLDGVTRDINDMIFGTPPVELDMTSATDPKDVSSHGIFETFYLETSFTFNAGDTTSLANTQDDPGLTPDGLSGMFYKAFNLDTSGMLEAFNLHFDLYHVVTKANGDLDVDYKAPWSHDASAPTTATPIPEPGTLALMGIALLGLGVQRKRKV